MKETTSATNAISLILACNEVDHRLRQSLACLEGQSLQRECYEVLLISSTSNYAAIAEIVEQFPGLSIRFIPCTDRYDEGLARNLGVQNARADLVLIHRADLLADEHLLKAHVELHALPSKDRFAALSSVIVDPSMPPRIFSEALQRANFLPNGESNAETLDLPQLQGISISLPRKYFIENSQIHFAESGLSSWGVEREFLYNLIAQRFTLIKHPHALAMCRPQLRVDSFMETIRTLTEDVSAIGERFPEARTLCPTVSAFTPGMVPHWREHLHRDEQTVELLLTHLNATQDLIARFHSEIQARQSNALIDQTAECLLLFREYLAQQALVEIHTPHIPGLASKIELLPHNKKQDEVNVSAPISAPAVSEKLN
jgi:hypothetical protein